MRILNCAFAVAFLFILSSLGTGQEAPGLPPELAQPKSAGTGQAITVFFDPNFPVSLEDVSEIIQSKYLAGAAIEELTGQRATLSPSEEPGQVFGWKTSSGKEFSAYVNNRRDLIAGDSPGSLPVQLTVIVTGDFDEGKAVAEKYAGLVVKHLNKIVADLSRRGFEQKLEQLATVAEEARELAEAAERKRQEMRAKYRQESGVLSESLLQELVSDLKKQQQALEVELAGMKGRADALQGELAKTAERVKKEPAADDVLRNLFRVIELRKRQLAAVRELHQQGTAGGEGINVAKAEEQVALGEVELAQAKRTVSRAAAEQLDKLNSELSHIAVNTAEIEAKLKYVTRRLVEHLEMLKQEAEAKPLREQLDDQSDAVALLQALANQAAMQVKQLESSFRPARVEVFELKTSEDKPANTEKGEKR